MKIFSGKYSCRDYIELYIKSKDNYIYYERNGHIKQLDKPYIVDCGDYFTVYMNHTNIDNVLKIIKEVAGREVLYSSKG